MSIETLVLPISEISSYHNRWTIKARVTGKSQLRQFNKGISNGKVFSVDLLDKGGGEIRASFFNQAADKYLDILEVGKCYVLTKGSVKVANRQYNQCNHRYELIFDKDALVAPAANDIEIKTMQFNFTDLRALQSKTLPATVALCGVVVSFKPLFSFKSRDGKDLIKREVTVADDTATSIDITLWGERAQLPDATFEGKPLVAIKSVIVKEWNGGRAGSLLQDGLLEFKPTGVEAERILKWWSNGGSSTSFSAMSISGGLGGTARKAKDASLADIRRVSESLPENSDIYTVIARMCFVQTTKQGQRQPLCYSACSAPREGTQLLCNKRVDESGRCPVCGSIGKGVARLNVRFKFVDFADSIWATTFHEGAESILGKSGQEILDLEKHSGSDGTEVDEFLKQRYYLGVPHQLTIRAKTETYQNETRCSISCTGARPVSLAEHGKQLLSEIHQMLGAPAA